MQLLTAILCGSLLVGLTAACLPQGETPPEITPLGQSTQQSSEGWAVVSQLPRPLESHQTIVLNDVLYVLGGWNDTRGPYAEIFFTPMTSAGPSDNWQMTSTALPSRLQHHAAIVHNKAIYVLGGDNGFWEGSTVSDRIFRAVPTANGDITEWVEVGQLPMPLTVHTVTTLDNQIYVMGGSQTFRPGLTFEDRVFTATFAEDGTVGDFEPLATFPTPIGWLTAIALDQQIVALSGKTQFRPRQLTESVWVANAQMDGTLSPFELVSTVIPRQRHTTVLVNRTVVVIAGGGDRQVLTSVQAADIDAQGNLMAWRELPALPSPRYAHAAFTYNGDIFVSGGFVRYGSNETSPDIFRLPLSDR